MEERFRKIEQDVAALQERNRRVEAEKGWETSYVRVLSIVCITYAVAALVLSMIGVKNYFLAALVPALGYALSTLSLPAVRRWWIKTFLR